MEDLICLLATVRTLKTVDCGWIFQIFHTFYQILWGSGMTYNVDFWLEFQNLPHILKDLLQIVRIWNFSTLFS